MMILFSLLALTLSASVKRKASSLSLNLAEDLEESKEEPSIQGTSSDATLRQRNEYGMTNEFYYLDEIDLEDNSRRYFKVVRSIRRPYNDKRKKYEVFKAEFNVGNYLPDYEILKTCPEYHLCIQSYTFFHPSTKYFTFKLKCNCSPVKTECFFEMEILKDFKENIFLIKQDYDRLEEIEREMFESKTDEEYKAFSDKCCERFIQILDSANSDLYYICIEAASLNIFFKKVSETKDYKKYKCLKTIYMLNMIVSNAKVDRNMRYFHMTKGLSCMRFKETSQKNAETAFLTKLNVLANFFTLLIQCLPNKRKLMYLYSNITIMRNQLFKENISRKNLSSPSKTSLINILLNILFLMSKEELQEVIMNFDSYRRYFLSSIKTQFLSMKISKLKLFYKINPYIIINYFLKIFDFYLNRFPSSMALENGRLFFWLITNITYKKLIEFGLLKTMERGGFSDIFELTIKFSNDKEACATLFIYVSLDLYRKMVFAEFGMHHLTKIRNNIDHFRY